jgi:hypothetical protein
MPETHEELGFGLARSYTWINSLLSGVVVTAKETVRALLDRLPDECSLDDVLYHLYVVQAAAQGLADSDAGRTLSHEQVALELRRKWLLGSVQ